MVGGGERMSANRVVISFDSEEIIRLTKILLDEEKEEAFAFLNEILKPKVDQATRSH